MNMIGNTSLIARTKNDISFDSVLQRPSDYCYQHHPLNLYLLKAERKLLIVSNDTINNAGSI